MRYKIIMITLLGLMSGGLSPLAAQEQVSELSQKKEKKAWEIGVGGTVMQFSRVQFSNFKKLENGGYDYDLSLRNALLGGDLYVAREMNKHFYLDMQGSVGMVNDRIDNSNKARMLYKAGLGLQWRLSPLLSSRYVDPYLRAGISYMYKEFDINYVGVVGTVPSDMDWVLQNYKNKHGADRNHMTPISLGAGVNTWFNDRVGAGFQADYIIMPYKNVANSMQGTIRLMWRIGGKSKKPSPVVKFVDREVIREVAIEKIVEKPVIVEKIVEVKTEGSKLIEFFNNITFDFDKATLTEESKKIMDEVAEILKQNTSKKFLITGYTDSKGSQSYNIDLSRRRAATIVGALVERGVPKEVLKSRGVGMKIAYATPNTENHIREADRKVTIEIITNMDYWNYIPEK